MKVIEFNLNEYVHVKLTEVGKNEIKRQWSEHNKLFPDVFPEFTPKKEDENGFSKWQMHSLISQLGGLCIMGKTPPFETAIKLEIE